MRPAEALAGVALAGAALLVAGFWIPLKAELAQWLLDRAWQAMQTDETQRAKPWPWADTWPVARLTLPHHAPLTVLAGATGRNLAFGPALLDGSAPPGEAGVTVIAGHRDTHFRPLQTLAVGDRISIERPDGTSVIYEVTATDIVDATDARLALDAPEPTLALVTCYPFDAPLPGGPLRYVVTAVRF